jgi:lysophospholipase L1-like esterase
VTTQIKILCIGDSHTAGYPFFDPQFGGNPRSSYEYYLNLLLSNQFPNVSFVLDNQGICGQVTYEIVQRYRNLINFRYDLVIFWGGANDIAVGYPVDDIWNNLKSACKLTVGKPFRVVLITIPPMNWPGIGQKIIELNDRIDNYNKLGKCLSADVYGALEKNDELKSQFDAGDGVHLSIEGYEKVGEVIFNSIRRYLTDLIN